MVEQSLLTRFIIRYPEGKEIATIYERGSLFYALNLSAMIVDSVEPFSVGDKIEVESKEYTIQDISLGLLATPITQYPKKFGRGITTLGEPKPYSMEVYITVEDKL